MTHRRSNNEGSIYQRKDGLWCAQVTLDGKRLTRYGKTQKDVRTWLKEILGKIDRGLTYEGTKVTLEQFTQDWLEAKALSTRSHTIHQYRQVAGQHILPTLGRLRLQDLGPYHLKQLYLRKQAQGCGARTIQIIHAVLYSILKQAVREGILVRNPAEMVDRPRTEEVEHQILDEDQARQLIIGSAQERNGMIYYLALMTGMREGELLGLKWSDVDWEHGVLNVQRQLQRVIGVGRVLVPPKTKAGRRQIKLGDSTLERLSIHRARQDKQRLESGERWIEHDLIFPNKLGKPMAFENMYVEFKRFLKKNGLPDIRFHDLRHTSISLLLNLGTPVNTVQQRAGHSKASITTDTYGHVMMGSQDEAARKLEERLVPILVEIAVEKQ